MECKTPSKTIPVWNSDSVFIRLYLLGLIH